MQQSRQRRAGDEAGVSGGSEVMLEKGARLEAGLLWDKVGLTQPDLHAIEGFLECETLRDKTRTVPGKPGGLDTLDGSLGFSFFSFFSFLLPFFFLSFFFFHSFIEI